MKKGLIIVSLMVFAGVLFAEGSDGKAEARKFCSTLKVDYVPTCLNIVNKHAKFYEPELVSFCDSLSYNWHKIYCIDRGRNSKFGEGSLAACKNLTHSSAYTQSNLRLDCMTNAAEAETLSYEKATTRMIWAENYPAFQELVVALNAQAKRTCWGYTYVQFVDPDWKQNHCWVNSSGWQCQTDVKCSGTFYYKSNYETISYSGYIE